MSNHLPVYGPTTVTGDEESTPVAVVRVAVALSREQLLTALAVSFTEMDLDRDASALTVAEVRTEVEGYLATAALASLDRDAPSVHGRVFPLHQQAIVTALAEATERAYPVKGAGQ